MKKVFNIVCAAIVSIFGLASCSNDGDDLPKVDFTLNVSGGANVDGVLYVVQGTDLVIDGIDVVSEEPGSDAIITAATYYFDTYRLGTSALPPYGITIPISQEAKLGRHNLAIECPVYAEGKSPAIANLYYIVEVVASEDDMPQVPAGRSTSVAVDSHILAK